MTKERSEILINNILTEICEKTEIPQDQYEDWLTQEVGFTKEELGELKDDGYYPEPRMFY